MGKKPLVSECAEVIARQFQSLAPEHGWIGDGVIMVIGMETQAGSRTKWEDLPEESRDWMIAAFGALLERGVIRCGEHP